jgi:methyl-accepting chemotaxis protein
MLARIRAGEDLAALARPLIVTIALGGAVFGAALGAYRGGLQVLYAAIKLPLATLLTAAICAPTLTALNAALGRAACIRRDFALVLAVLARGALVVAAEAPVVLSLFLAWTISRPLGRLTRLAARIAAGDRTAQLALERRDEIGQLARAFDAMTRRLDERARYIGELSADISHEFKSPLTSIRGAAELLLDGPAVVEVHSRARAMHLLGRRAHLASVVGNLVDNAQAFAAPGSTSWPGARPAPARASGCRCRSTSPWTAAARSSPRPTSRARSSSSARTCRCSPAPCPGT